MVLGRLLQIRQSPRRASWSPRSISGSWRRYESECHYSYTEKTQLLARIIKMNDNDPSSSIFRLPTGRPYGRVVPGTLVARRFRTSISSFLSANREATSRESRHFFVSQQNAPHETAPHVNATMRGEGRQRHATPRLLTLQQAPATPEIPALTPKEPPLE